MNVWFLLAAGLLYIGQAGTAAWVHNWPITVAFVCYAVANFAFAYNLGGSNAVH